MPMWLRIRRWRSPEWLAGSAAAGAVDLRSLLKSQSGRLLIGIALVAVNRGAAFVLPLATKVAIDDVVGHGRTWMLDYLVAGVLIAGLIQGTSAVVITQIFSSGTYRLVAQLRCRLHAHVVRLPLAFYDATKSGVLLSRIMNDVEGVRNLVGSGLLAMVSAAVTSVVSIALLFRISPLLTVMTLGIMVLYLVVSRRAMRSMRPIYSEGGRIMGEVTGRLTESLGGARVVKAYNAEAREQEVFAAGVQRIATNALASVRVESRINFTASTFTAVVGAAIIYTAVQQIGAGALTLGGFGAFTTLVAFLIGPIQQLAQSSARLAEAAAACDRITEIFRQKPEDADPRRTLAPERLDGAIAFDQVSFAYEPGKEVLREISFRAEPGTVTALVGASGAGKSTLTGLVAAFYVPTSGCIRIDGVDLSRIRLDAYRSRLGIVLQETFLFDGTIAENVAFARPAASREEILEACRIARVDEFAERFSDGYDTIVGERGVKLSGGQKQRVSIARAVLADPAILILDEATSSLDSESEAFIQVGLKYLMRSRTSLVIAHRLSTIQRADQILVLDAGRIVERGTHESLYRAGARYYDLYTRQYGHGRPHDSELALAGVAGGTR